MIRRRFGKSLANFAHTYLPLADVASVMDNTREEPRLIAEKTKTGGIVVLDGENWRAIMEAQDG